MNALTRWNPFREMEELQRRLSSVFDLAPMEGNNLRRQNETISAAEWSPAVDISEDDREYLITAELPQIKRDEINVTLESGVLTISGERKFEKEEQGKKYHRVERAYGKFVRSFNLPDDADPEKVNAEFKDGILRVHVAKNETAKRKQIQVKVS